MKKIRDEFTDGWIAKQEKYNSMPTPPTHTPTPWKVVIKSSYSVHIESENAPESRLHIAKMDTYAGGKNPKFLEADAAMIVLAVNAYQPMVELLHETANLISRIKPAGSDYPLVKRIEQAIARAEGKE